jgi:hypothetical protein
MTVQVRALKALARSLGLANPLWLAYGGAATLGASWWLMRRMAGVSIAHPDPAVLALPVMAAPPEVIEARAPLLEAPIAAVAVVAEAIAPEVVVALPAPSGEAVPAGDDLTQDDLMPLVGVGPRTAST